MQHMNPYVVNAIVSVVTAAITAFSTISVAKIQSKKSAEVQDHPVSPIQTPAPAAQGVPGAYFNSLNIGVTAIVPQQDGAMIVTASGSCDGGGEFRSYFDVFIKVDGKTVGQARSYIPVNWGIQHLVNASCIVPVFAGKPLTLELKTAGEGLKGQVAASGMYALIPVPK